MGYRRKGTVFALRFEDPELGGLVVNARKPSMAGQLDLMGFSELADLKADSLSNADIKRLREMFDFFGRFLVDWNLEDEDGNPVSCDTEGLLAQDDGFVLSIVNAWMDAVGTVAPPLDARSNGGPPSVVASIPTEPL